MKRIKVGIMLLILSFVAHARSVESTQFVDPSQVITPEVDVTGMAPFEQADKIIHFKTDRVAHFADGSMYICPHNATITYAMDQKYCVGPNAQTAWVPLMTLNVQGFEVVGVRFTFTDKGDIGLLVYFRRLK